MKEKKRVPAGGEPMVWQSPFAALKNVELLPTLAARPTVDQTDSIPAAPRKNRWRVDIIRSTGRRGGKTVTVVTGFVGIGQDENERLAKEMQKACGAGGTVKDGRIEIQGDQREAVARILTNVGFRPVSAGG